MPQKQDDTVIADLDAVETHLATAKQEARAAMARIEELEVKLRIARGTANDVRRQAEDAAAMVAPAPAPATLDEKLEQFLRENIASLDEIAKALNAAPGRLATMLKDLNARRSIYNVGSEDRPRWVWRIGDSTSARDLRDMIQQLITDQPLTTAELVAATGARASRVGGAIVDIQRDAKIKILDLGTPGRGRWFIITEQARDAHISPKAPRK